MKTGPFQLVSAERTGLGGLLTPRCHAGLWARPRLAGTNAAVDTSACGAPTLAQALLPFGDSTGTRRFPAKAPTRSRARAGP